MSVIRKLMRKLQAEAAMNLGWDDGILEIIGEAVALGAKVEPRLRILMNEKRGVRTDVTRAFVLEGGPLPCAPRFRGQRVRVGAESEQANHHMLAVEIPPVGQEAEFWRPAV